MTVSVLLATSAWALVSTTLVSTLRPCRYASTPRPMAALQALEHAHLCDHLARQLDPMRKHMCDRQVIPTLADHRHHVLGLVAQRQTTDAIAAELNTAQDTAGRPHPASAATRHHFGAPVITRTRHPITYHPYPTADASLYGGYAAMPSWVPTDRVRGVACGEHFEAIRVGIDDGLRAHRLLGPRSGPVLASVYTQTVVFLLEPGVLGSQALPGARTVRHGARVEIPPAAITGGRDVHWVVRPGEGTTDLAALRAALLGRPVTSTRSQRTGPGGRPHHGSSPGGGMPGVTLPSRPRPVRAERSPTCPTHRTPPRRAS
ncbi:MAG: hypothetical protein JO362_00475 [Streptomycetaceae bacterium]|nr:hypothetical protein [Streptomycetaceae bacterium]